MDVFNANPVAIYDPILDIKPRTYIPVLKGGQYTSFRTFVAPDASNSSTNMNVPPPNPSTIVSRKIFLKTFPRFLFQVNFGQAQTFQQRNLFAPKAYPILSLIRTLEVIINGCSLVVPLNNILKSLLWFKYNDADEWHSYNSGTPAMLDRHADYYISKSNVAGASVGCSIPTANGMTVNFFGHPWLPRGSWPMITNPGDGAGDVTGAGLTQVTFEWQDYSPLMISPLIFDDDCEDEGFVGIQSLYINITWESRPEFAVSLSPERPNIGVGAVGNWLVVPAVWGFNDRKPELLFKYVTPPAGMAIPRSIQYNYNEIQVYYKTFNIGGVATLPSFTDELSDTIQLNAIPRYMIVAVVDDIRRNPDQDNGLKTPDIFGNITDINVNWNNQNNLLTSADAFQLYQMNRKNGYRGSWSQYSSEKILGFQEIIGNNNGRQTIDYTGAPLCIEFGTDIGLRDGEAPGLIGVYNLQVQVSGFLKCLKYTTAIPPAIPGANAGLNDFRAEIRIIIITPGVFTIYDNSASKRKGVINMAQIKAAGPGRINYKMSSKQDLIKGGKQELKRALSVAKKVAPIGDAVEMASSALGYPGVGRAIGTAARLPRSGLRFARKNKKKVKGLVRKAKAEAKKAEASLKKLAGMGINVGGMRRTKKKRR